MPNPPWIDLCGFAAALAVVVAWIPHSLAAQQRIRVATFNASLHGRSPGEIADRLRNPSDVQGRKIAAVVQTVRPDVLLINELDDDTEGRAAELLATNFFAVAQENRQPIEFPYRYVPPSNTGVDSAMDLDGNTKMGEPNDAWGFGGYAGQYSMAVFSRFSIDPGRVRTFQHYRWCQLPEPLRPRNPGSDTFYHDEAIWQTLRLSSKNHVDVPIQVGGQELHLLASHPTPPVFDGPEDRNGCRNHDEVRFWIDYLSGPAATHLMDDKLQAGGIETDSHFVIAGDLNADPIRGDGRRDAILKLLSHQKVQDPRPRHRSFVDQNSDSLDDSTADFGDTGQLRVDYVLPSRELCVKSSGVFWPRPGQEGEALLSASDHRLVWVDIEIP